MNGHDKNMYFQLPKQLPATVLSLILVMAVDSTRAVSECPNQQSGNYLQRTLKLIRITNSESSNLIKVYKASQGATSELFCQVQISDVPDSNISGLGPSERLLSIYAHVQAFLPHIKRVLEQQTDLQDPLSPLLTELSMAYNRLSGVASQVKCTYQTLFPNLPIPEPAGGPTPVPPSKNIFQQKVYGCVVLKKYKEFLSNASRELRTLKKIHLSRTDMNTLL